MRHFFITSFERLMNVMVVLTGLGILALSGKMAMDAQGNVEMLLRALLVFLGGFVALITFAGVAYLAIGNHNNLRRVTRWMEAGGRNARPLTATRSIDVPTHHSVEPTYPQNDAPAVARPVPQPSSPGTAARFASVMRAQNVRRVPQGQSLRAPAPGQAEPRPAQTRQPEAREPEARHVEPRLTEPRVTEPRISEPRQPELRHGEPRLSSAEPFAAPSPMRAPEPQQHHQPSAHAYQPRIEARVEPHPEPQPRLSAQELYAPYPQHVQDSEVGIEFAAAEVQHSASFAPEAHTEQPAPAPVAAAPIFSAAKPMLRPSVNDATPSSNENANPQPQSSANKIGRLVADRRPLR